MRFADLGVKGVNIRSRCFSSNFRSGAAMLPFAMSFSITQSRLSHQDSFVISEGAIERIKYRTRAAEEACST